jgi:hypothetical protein
VSACQEALLSGSSAAHRGVQADPLHVGEQRLVEVCQPWHRALQRQHLVDGARQARHLYEELLGLPLAGTLDIKETKSGRATQTLHSFYRLDDGSFLAFFRSASPA